MRQLQVPVPQMNYSAHLVAIVAKCPILAGTVPVFPGGVPVWVLSPVRPGFAKMNH